MQIAAGAGALGRMFNPGMHAIMESNVVLDVSGGDSFTDMYPDDRIDGVAGCKELVLESGRPLLLLPQTYGPFDESLDRASRIVREFVACYARDERSFENLRSMLGHEFDSDRHKCGVDMAFGLSVRDPQDGLDRDLRDWIGDVDDRIQSERPHWKHTGHRSQKARFPFRISGNRDGLPLEADERDRRPCSPRAARHVGGGRCRI